MPVKKRQRGSDRAVSGPSTVLPGDEVGVLAPSQAESSLAAGSGSGSGSGSKRSAGGGFSARRYTEDGSTIASGLEVGPSLDGPSGGDLGDVDLAEKSLGERLKSRRTLMEEPRPPHLESASSSSMSKDAPTKRSVVPATSLSQVLTQALHSSDEALLTSCLVHTNLDVVQSTVARVPSVLVPGLVEALIQRFVGGKGKLGSSTQKIRGVVLWVNQVLLLHAGYLMTMPDIKTRLATLQSAIEHRLLEVDRLQALRGRLDLIIAQADLQDRSRSSTGPGRTGKKNVVTGQRPVDRYVEGETEEDDDDDDDEATDDVVVQRADESAANVDEITMMLDGEPDDHDGDEDLAVVNPKPRAFGNGVPSYSDDEEDDDKLVSEESDEEDSDLEESDEDEEVEVEEEDDE